MKKLILLLSLSLCLTARAQYQQPNQAKLVQLTGTGAAGAAGTFLIPYSATIQVDPERALYQQIITNSTVGDCTLKARTVGNFGEHMELEIVNDAGGARTVTFSTGFSTITPFVGTAGTATILSFRSNGFLWNLAGSVASGVGSGTVTSVPDGSTNGVTWTVATRTTTPTFTFSLGAVTPSSVSIGADPADAGDIRLINAGIIGWEASPAGTDVTLTVNSAEQFVFSNAILSPDFATSITTASTSFTAFAGATTLMTIGGTGASASSFFPSTLDATSSTTGAIRTSGGISAAKAANFGTTLNVAGISGLGVASSSTTNLNLPAGTTSVSSLRIAHGAAPTSPVNGDAWTTTAGLFIRINGATVQLGSGAGDVVGPGSATDNAIARFDTTTGKLIQNSAVTVDDSGNISTAGTIAVGVGGSVAGGAQMGQGTLPTLGTTAATWSAPASVTSHNVVVPGTVGSTGLMLWTVASTTATISPVTTLPSGLTIPSPIFSTGATASGSGSYDLSGSSGTFKTQTGAGTIGPGALTISGIPTFTTAARSSGAAAYFTVTTPADTAQTASTESIGASFTAATRQFATGALTTQRERVFAAPTYGFVGASTLTTAINVDIADPIAGTNATLTNAYALRVAKMLSTGGITSTAGVNSIAPLVDSVDGTTPLNNINQVVASGTAYTMTTSYASVDFGTTDPVLTIANAGTYSIYVDIQTTLVSATTTTQTESFKLRRTNNTAADLTGATFGAPLPVATVGSQLGPMIHIGPIKYTTANTDDSITVQGILSASLGAGTVTVTACNITAIRAY